MSATFKARVVYADPATGQVFIQTPALSGDVHYPAVFTGVRDPITQWYDTPAAGDDVLVTFEASDPNRPHIVQSSGINRMNPNFSTHRIVTRVGGTLISVALSTQFTLGALPTLATEVFDVNPMQASFQALPNHWYRTTVLLPVKFLGNATSARLVLANAGGDQVRSVAITHDDTVRLSVTETGLSGLTIRKVMIGLVSVLVVPGDGIALAIDPTEPAEMLVEDLGIDFLPDTPAVVTHPAHYTTIDTFDAEFDTFDAADEFFAQLEDIPFPDDGTGGTGGGSGGTGSGGGTGGGPRVYTTIDALDAAFPTIDELDATYPQIDSIDNP